MENLTAEPTPVKSLITALAEKKSWHELLSRFQNLTDQERQEIRAKNEDAIRRREIEEQEQRRERLWKNDWPNFSGRFHTATFDNFALYGSDENRIDQARILSKLRTLELRNLIQRGTNILFIGPPGSGKDHLMFCLLRNCFEGLSGKRGIRFVNGSEFRMTTRLVRRSEDGSEREFVGKLTGKKLLCISDPAPTGGATLTESQAESMYQILDKRGFDRLPTWMTINLPLGQLLRDEATRIFTAPLWDRMKNDAIIVPTNWPSYRKPLATL